MGCKCFDSDSKIPEDAPYRERYESSKCTCNARFTVSENGCTFRLDTRELYRVDKVKVDRGLYSSNNQEKCDYLFVYKRQDGGRHASIFVELKGKNISKAYSQIESTIKRCCSEDPNLTTSQYVVAAIVHTKYPCNEGSIRKIKLKEKALKSFCDDKRFILKVYSAQKKLVLNPETCEKV